MCPLLNIWERWPSKGINILPKINTSLKVRACVLSCVWLCDSVDYSLPGSSLHEIIPEETPDWVTISFSRRSSWCRYRTHICCIGKWILYHWATWEAPMSQRTLRLAVSSSSQRKRIGRNPSNNPPPLSLPILPVARCPVLSCSAVSPWTVACQARILECCYALLQAIFPTQGLNLHLPHCRWILYQLSHQGSLARCPGATKSPFASQVWFPPSEIKIAAVSLRR